MSMILKSVEIHQLTIIIYLRIDELEECNISY